MFYVETYLKINIALFIHSSAFYRYCRGQGALLVLLISVDGNERTTLPPTPTAELFALPTVSSSKPGPPSSRTTMVAHP